ncbi:hypothetical protein N7495_003842 [Penicillium taxi]|uniref:uncharacterized protein n=1 Tax=Penicillium taxi TaxID=168475 RepID=UPI00254519ED|nr:uncharacterized protein N7495_003842 [Penicillium taxi]KAJ5899098.1 hypothetical protein N7495_003842 [Penicillium taxi]
MRASSLIPVLSISLVLNIVGVIATPLSLEENELEKRCANSCGYNGWLCCSSSQTCSENSAGEAVCLDSTDGWEYYTTTYVVTEAETVTVTSVWSSQVTTAAATTTTMTCRLNLGESTCGTTCCDAAQECQDGVCVAESSSAAITGEATPGVRQTSNGASTATATAAATTTEAFIAPVGTDGAELIGAKAATHSGLSGGAIAGIVIGVIAGVILLLLLCGCLCFRGALLGLLAALGLRSRRRTEETVVEERYSRHSSAGTRPRPRPAGRTWFGTRPSGTVSEISEKKKKSGGGLATVAIVLGALALCLGLRRHNKEEHHEDDRTDYTYPSSYYYYSEYTASEYSHQTLDKTNPILTFTSR